MFVQTGCLIHLTIFKYRRAFTRTIADLVGISYIYTYILFGVYLLFKPSELAEVRR